MTTVVPASAGQTPIDAFILKSATLQNAATGNGNGTDFDVTGMATTQLLINPTAWTGTVTFKASIDGTTFVNILGKQQDTGIVADTVANPGSTASVWAFQTAGLTKIRAVTSNAGGTSVTVTGKASPYANPETPDAIAADSLAFAAAGAFVQMQQTGTALASPRRAITKFVQLQAQSITHATPVSVYTPTTGKKWRVLGYNLSTTVAGAIQLEDTTGVEFLRTPLLAAAAPFASGDMGNGYLSSAANNQLFLDVTVTGILTGWIGIMEE
jgi:hypothetical protein